MNFNGQLSASIQALVFRICGNIWRALLPICMNTVQLTLKMTTTASVVGMVCLPSGIHTSPIQMTKGMIGTSLPISCYRILRKPLHLLLLHYPLPRILPVRPIVSTMVRRQWTYDKPHLNRILYTSSRDPKPHPAHLGRAHGPSGTVPTVVVVVVVVVAVVLDKRSLECLKPMPAWARVRLPGQDARQVPMMAA
jgi:hypothetical protein